MGATTVAAESEITVLDDEDIVTSLWMHSTPAVGMDGHWAKRLFQWGISQNIINGYSNSSLKPDQVITEAEFLKMLYRAMGMAIPNASSIYQQEESWTEGPYWIAKNYNHPALGIDTFSKRFQPITKLRAAEIISASQGVHYTGADTVAYLIGHGIANSEVSSPEQFDGNSTFTRAEALQWIRQLAFHGKLELYERPVVPTELSLIPDASIVTNELIPDFSTEPVTQEDFNLYGSGGFPGLTFGDLKQTVDNRFGKTTEQDIFDFDIYPLFSGHFNENGELDAWSVDLNTDTPNTAPLLSTKKGIVLGKSSLSDIISQYGSAGVSGQGIIQFFYEKTKDGTFQDISIYDPIQSMEDVYTITFIVDDETQVLYNIMVSSLKTALGYS
ncbi:S-layer homology domain-containing protein [Paenibacillus sp. FSL H7-0326]|uniref:S-layer homology domain-containing protein n=1 Tax=Paenibacillus sp. FSL H7-0326 TaxID=1921144 RepID=UPI0015C3C84A|nr:S-layer homology domain-containing protein [Paenibacillus sp. FSL H7-0326]